MDGAEIGGHGLADVGKRGAQPEVDAGAHLGAEGQQRHVLAGVVGAGNGGVAAVVGGEDGQVARAQRAFESRQPGVELLRARAP